MPARGNDPCRLFASFFGKKAHQPQRVPGIVRVRPDTCDTEKTALLSELVCLKALYDRIKEVSRCK
jgi:hypothetical protein